jgi:hypothetical protein
MSFQVRLFRPNLRLAAFGFALAAVGCDSANPPPAPTPTPVALSVAIAGTSVVVPQDGAQVQLAVSISGPTGTPTVTESGLPAGITGQFIATNGGPSGSILFTGSTATPAGIYPASVTVSLAGQTVSKDFSVVSAVVAKVLNTTDLTEGVSGHLQQFMSTNFQIAEWTEGFFGTGTTTTARESTLNSLQPQHIRLQAVSQAIPMKANSGLASDWDFTLLDQTVQPILASADHSPEFQIAVAPAWMLNPNTGHLDITNHLYDFATYAANLVLYYNKGGFEWGGTHFQSPGAHPITWWGVFNEPNINGLSADDYVQVYNTVVLAMLAVDPTIKLSAIELSDYGLGGGNLGDPEQYLPTFVAGVNTQVNAVTTHLYGTCNQLDTDRALFDNVPVFVDNLLYFEQALQGSPNLANVPVWVDENNVNADYSDVNGMSVCNPGQLWVLDQRATNAFFSAWRPYVFSQLGKAGNQALYHWEYTGGPQYDEVDSNGNPLLSYWVDKTLENFYPVTTASPGPAILTVTATDTSSVETLATKNANGTVTIMVVDMAVDAPADNNGAGDPRTVVVDTSSLGGFYTASVLTIDATTSASKGPSGVGVTPASRMTMALPGYGVAFLTLKP